MVFAPKTFLNNYRNLFALWNEMNVVLNCVSSDVQNAQICDCSTLYLSLQIPEATPNSTPKIFCSLVLLLSGPGKSCLSLIDTCEVHFLGGSSSRYLPTYNYHVDCNLLELALYSMLDSTPYIKI